MPEWIGKTIGKVRIEKLLARGGMAEVYLGSHLTLERPVAVKFLHSYVEAEPILLERFQREARVVAGLRHPNIVQIFDFDTTDGHPYIVMEYLRGPTLATYLRHLHQRKKRVPLEQIARLLQQLTAALDYAHGKGVIHRDIKPGNILLHTKTDEIPLDRTLPNDVEAIVTDFGVVRLVNAATQTVSGFLSGTPAYASPEQARGDQTDHRTDLYSLGIVLYEMLAGRIPFEADNTVTILHMHIHMTPPPIPGISAKVQAVVDRALQKNPDDRYQTSPEMAIDFYRAIGMIAQAEAIPEPRMSPVSIEEQEPGEGAISWLPKPTPIEPVPVLREPLSQPVPIVPVLIEPELIVPKPAPKPTLAPIASEPAPKPQPAPIAPEPPLKPARSRVWIGVGLISLVLAVGGYLLFNSQKQALPPTETFIPSPNTPNTNPPPTAGLALPDGTNMVQIPAGTYTVGRDPADDNHVAQQKVELDSFWIDQYQTTNAEYQQYLAANSGIPTPVVWPAKSGEEKHPVRGVTWDQANAYCQWRNKRLPTEAEWEAAGRGRDAVPYPWGTDGFRGTRLPDDNTYDVDSHLYDFNVSPFGVYGMVGNVWEWVGKLYDDSFPAEYKVLRGGRFSNPVDLAFRLPTTSDDPKNVKYAGFRCAADQVK